MIRQIEIAEASRAWNLRHHIAEKDYVLGWLLVGLSANVRLQAQWVFKGGTCLKKCYLETYRFSEDLDFTLTPDASRDVGEITRMVREVCEQVSQESGIEFHRDMVEFRAAPNPRGGVTLRGKVGYRGPLQQPTLPKIQFDLTTDEIIALPPILRPIYHPYSDRPARTAKIRCYPLEEILAEKTRAMCERGMPRDLYDIIRLFRHEGLHLNANEIQNLVAQKCAQRGLPIPAIAEVEASPRHTELQSEWANMLGHQLPTLPPLETFWQELSKYFDWLYGEAITELSPVQELEASDPAWRPPEYMSLPSAWNVVAPIEAIRFAGANRLRVQLSYIPEKGRPGVREVEPYSFRRSRVREVEPYSFRRSRAGYLLFYGRNIERPRISAYRFDRIRDVKVTMQPFVPRWRVEF
jgi:predicted nucleotidyltransferase component of viral defense system